MKYRTEVEDKNGWSRWIQPKRKNYRFMCCDCGLVHTMQFKVLKNGRGVFILFRASRNVRATAASRRSRGIKSS